MDSDTPVATTVVTPGQVAEALVYAPIGLGATLIADAPARLRQFRSDLTAARFLGEMVVTQGAAHLRARRAAGHRADESGQSGPTRQPIATDAPLSAAADEPAGVDDPDASATPVAPELVAVVDAKALAIPDYDTVPAIDIVGQLDDLDAAERALIERYETANRRRRTILGKLGQLETAP